MKIAFISGVKYGHELLSHLLEQGIDVSIIFSYNDSTRKRYSDNASFENLAEKFSIQNIQVGNINETQNIKILEEISPDLILVMGWSQIINDSILNIPKIGVIGSHPTELPKYRGRAPIPWTILKNLKESALTLFYMSSGIDNGDILDQKKFSISDIDDATSIYEKIILLGKEMLLENLPLLEMGTATRMKQDETKFIEYWKKRTPEDGHINWSSDGKEILNLIRATTHPYPGAYTFFKNSKLCIWKAEYLDKKNNTVGMLNVEKDGVEIGTGNGVIKILSISFDGVEMYANDFFLSEHTGIVLGN
tara:strand:+ start:3412 stop:4329 length:918 start_codon:yes stop_codon:yes gene_type:complete